MIFFLMGFCVFHFFWAYTDSFLIAGGVVGMFLLLYAALYYCILRRIDAGIYFYQTVRYFVAGFLLSVCSICVWVWVQQLQLVDEEIKKWEDSFGTQKNIVDLSIVQHVRANTYIGKTQKGSNIYLSSLHPLPVGKRILFMCSPVWAYRPGGDLGDGLGYLSGPGEWRKLVLDDDMRFQRRLTTRGMRAYCFVGSFTVLGSGDLPFWYTMRFSLQKKILSYIEEPLYRSLLLGSTIGDASQFSKEKYQQFVDAGLVHLLVVSGGNIALLLTVLSVLLIWLPIRWRWVLCICFVLIYTYICGADSSILRATVMSIITLLAILGGRTIDIWRLIGYAIIVLLIVNPYFLVYDLGFMLSFGSVAGICLWSHVWGKNVYMRYLSSLWGAVYGTLPIVLFLGNGWNIASILANFCVEFLYILLYVIIFFQIVAILMGGWVSDVIQICGSFISQLIFWIAEVAVTREIRVGTQSIMYVCVFGITWSAWGVLVYIFSLKKPIQK